MLPQDLHIHTIFSENDGAVLPQQTMELVKFANHAKVVGISDHIEHFVPHKYEEYVTEVRKYGFKLGTEVDGNESVALALAFKFDYYVYHCWGPKDEDYLGLEKLQKSGKPVIVAHPYALGTELGRISPDSIVEINNRYIWRYNWRCKLEPFLDRFKWVYSSDAHQPNWLNQTMARQVGKVLGVKEHLVFD